MKGIKIVLLIGSVLVSFMSNAQSLSLSQDETDYSNDTLFLTATTDSALLEAHIWVHNKTDKDIDVKVKKTVISAVANTENTFCWGSCFPPFVVESPAAVTIAANGTDHNSFVGDYSPKEQAGTTIIRYTFFNDANPDDSVALLVYFQVGAAGVADWSLDPGLVTLYPNPASDRLAVKFQSALKHITELRIIGITGQTVYKQSINRGEKIVRIDLSPFPQGNYFLIISDQTGASRYKKLIISR